MWDYLNKTFESLNGDLEITSFGFIANGELFCLGYMDGKLKICEFHSMKKTQIIFEHAEKIRFLNEEFSCFAN